MFSILKKATQSSTKLPAIVEPKVKSTDVALLSNSVKDETFGLDDESVEVLEPEEHADTTKPLYHEYWIRSMDTQKLIYFYNVRTGESSWLGPCGTCCKDSHKYCIDCGKAYCDTHFKKRHEKKSRHKHKWAHADPPNPDKLDPRKGSAHCIECSLKEATLMCTDCWDGYCETCFHLVHHCGDLIYHQAKPYLEAKKGWTVVLGTAKEPEYYVHGETEKTTFEKPYELMSPLEKRFFRQFKKVEAKVQELVEEVEKVQFEVEGTRCIQFVVAMSFIFRACGVYKADCITSRVAVVVFYHLMPRDTIPLFLPRH